MNLKNGINDVCWRISESNCDEDKGDTDDDDDDNDGGGGLDDDND